MQAVGSHQELITLISKEIPLPSPPSIIFRILESLSKEDSFSTLGGIIATDPALTTKILRYANSSVFARPATISSVDRALSLLGLNLVSNLALSCLLASTPEIQKKSGLDIDHFWRKSILIASATEVLGKHLQVRSDSLFTSGLLLDIGQLLLSQTHRDFYPSQRNETTEGLLKREHKQYGYDHRQVSYALLLSWKFPESITLPILNMRSDSDVFGQILRLADLLSDVYNQQINKKELVDHLKISYMEMFPHTTIPITIIIDELTELGNELVAAFELPVAKIPTYDQMLYQAFSQIHSFNLKSEEDLFELKQLHVCEKKPCV